jgi:TRAP-type mannitol/chloroaromatic compound transport system permease small subunit
MIRILQLYANAIDRLSEGLGALSMYLVLPTIFIGFANVVLRYAGQFVGTRLTSNAIIEIQWYLYSLIFFFGFAYILKNNINVRVDFWYGQQSQKRKAIIDFVGHLIALIPFCFLGLAVTYNPVMLSWGRRFDGSWGTWEMSPDPSGLPRAPIKTMILVGFFTLLLQAIVELIRLYGTLRDIDELKRTTPLEREEPLRVE